MGTVDLTGRFASGIWLGVQCWVSPVLITFLVSEIFLQSGIKSGGKSLQMLGRFGVVSLVGLLSVNAYADERCQCRVVG